MFSNVKSIGAKYHRDVANLNSRGIVGRIYYNLCMGTTKHCYTY